MTLSGETTAGQSGSGLNGNEEVLRIPQSSSITGDSLSYCIMSYIGHSLGGSYPSSDILLGSSTAPAMLSKSL